MAPMPRWKMSERFPRGFDEWCRVLEPPAGRTDTDFSSFFRSSGIASIHEAAKAFIRSVIGANTHWQLVAISSSDFKLDWDFQFPTGHEPHLHNVTMDSTDIWSLEVSGDCNSFRVSGLSACNISLFLGMCKTPVQLTNCVIGNLRFTNRRNSAHHLSLELHNCWVGNLVIPEASLKNLSITGGGVANFDCPPADGPNPFLGAVIFKRVFFPTSPRQTSLFMGPQSYRSLHAHLKKHDNMLMCNQMRSYQLCSERSSESGFAKITNWVYGTFANYGTSPGRPLWWLIGLFLIACGYIYMCDRGMLTQPPESYLGANASLLDENGGRLNRSLLLPLHSIVNPFGIFFDSRKLMIPSTLSGSLLLTVQGLCSDVLLLMTALSIRRRFKAE